MSLSITASTTHQINFKEKHTDKDIEFNIDKELYKKLETQSSILETRGEVDSFDDYMSDIWDGYQNFFNNKDSNENGYLDLDELTKSRRVFNEDREGLIHFSSFNEITDSQEDANSVAKEYLEKEYGSTNHKLSVEEDFEAFLEFTPLDDFVSTEETLVFKEIFKGETTSNDSHLLKMLLGLYFQKQLDAPEVTSKYNSGEISLNEKRNIENTEQVQSNGQSTKSTKTIESLAEHLDNAAKFIQNKNTSKKKEETLSAPSSV